MALENVTGNLLAYKELEQGTFQHTDQLTTERKTNHKLRENFFYTADGGLFTVQKGTSLLVITREPQNLVLRDIDEAYRQLISQGNYFPDAEAAQDSLVHKDSVVIDLKALKLEKIDKSCDHFVVYPENLERLNSEQRRAAQRIYGLDEGRFGLNMETFAEAKITPHIFVLSPDYVRDTLRRKGKEFVGRASWLYNFNNNSFFGASGRDVNFRYALRGVRKIAEGGAPKNEVPQTPQETGQVVLPLERMLELSRPYVPDHSWQVWEKALRKEYKQ